ncbi:MAG: MBL fold metallo-hydrolase [Clostridia bacterium]|nr:MBL fold metallo-hydrolase [Clostridia bacterium]
MILKTFRAQVGEFQTFTNMYVVFDEETKEGILIDAGAGADKIINYIENMNVKLKYIILTHCHVDHVADLRKIRKDFPRVPIVINEEDAEGLAKAEVNMCELLGVENNFLDADILVKDGDVLTFGNVTAQLIHTPGHTAGSMSILIEDALFSGDTLFKGTRGRTDLPTGSEREILWSIKDKLLKLPEETIVYPGHGSTTIIRDEKEWYVEE